MRRRRKYSSAEVYELADLGDDQAAAAVRRVAKCSGPGRYALRQWTPQTKESRVQRQALSVERLRLRTALLQRL